MDTIGLSRLLRAAALLLSLALPFAQAHADVDPPGRVARLNYFSGTVTFAPAGTDEWANIHVNRPLISGDRIWVDRGGRSEMHVGSTVVRLGGETSLGIVRVDDDVAQLKLTQGTLNLHVRTLASGQVYEIDTPNLAFSVQSPGTYRIDVAPDGGMTTVTIRHGSAIAYGAASNTTMSEGQQLSFTGNDLQLASSAGSPPFDDFDRWANDRDRAEDTAASARYVSRDVIGYEELDSWGTWRSTPQYGMVWVPRVTIVDWAPYRTGHWAWISPWGWTWVDDAPWGFAPYHYGRWAYVDRTWCWVPGRIVTVRPVYAPALVAFVGGGSGVSFSLTIGGTRAPAVGWFPLGPGEIYRPAYGVSQTYIHNVNKTVVVNNTTINNTTINNVTVNKTVYVNKSAPNAITAVPVNVFSRGEPVTRAAQSVSPQMLKNVSTITTAPPVTPPAHGLVGLTPHPTPPAARTVFERPVVATTPAPGHRTVRAALAGQPMPTVERNDNPKPPVSVPAPQPAAGQPVPAPSRNLSERPAVPVRGEQRGEREPKPQHDMQHEAVPRPPHHAEERPAISRLEPPRPVAPPQENKAWTPAATPSVAAPAQVQQPSRAEPQVERHHPAAQHVQEQRIEPAHPEGRPASEEAHYRQAHEKGGERGGHRDGDKGSERGGEHGGEKHGERAERAPHSSF